MPRISLKRHEVDLLLNLVSNRLLGLSDDRARAEEDGDQEFLAEVNSWGVEFDALATKLSKASVRP